MARITVLAVTKDNSKAAKRKDSTTLVARFAPLSETGNAILKDKLKSTVLRNGDTRYWIVEDKKASDQASVFGTNDFAVSEPYDAWIADGWHPKAAQELAAAGISMAEANDVYIECDNSRSAIIARLRPVYA